MLSNVTVSAQTTPPVKLPEFEGLANAGIPYVGNEPLYQAVINKPFYANKLVAAFIALTKAGARYSGNEALYDAIIKKPARSDKLAAAFVELINASIFYLEDEALYQAMISNPYFVDKLVNAFFALRSADIFYNGNETLYQAVINNASYADKLGTTFVILTKAGACYSDNEAFYEAIIKNASHADKWGTSFEVLTKGGIPYVGNEALYQSLIDNVFYVDKLVAAFIALSKAGVSYSTGKMLYDVVINNIRFSNEIAIAFSALTQAGIFYCGNETFYQAVINNLHDIGSIVSAFAILKKAGASYSGNENFYKSVIRKLFLYNGIITAMDALLQLGFIYPGNEALYQAVINNAQDASKIVIEFTNFTNSGIAYSGNEMLYKAIADQSFRGDKLAKVFITLFQEGVLYSGNEIFYQGIINRYYDLDKLAVAFSGLFNAGVVYYDNEPLYQALVDSSSTNESLPLILEKIKEFGIEYDQCPSFFNANSLIIYGKWTESILDDLMNAGYNSSHRIVCNTLLEKLSVYPPRLRDICKMVSVLTHYAKTNKLLDAEDEGYQAQIGVLKHTLEQALIENNMISFGPLNKAKATIQVETILNHIAKNNDAVITFNSITEHYILTIPGQKEINLSLLLKNANLSQLTLEAHVIEQLGNILKIYVDDWFKPYNPTDVIKLLPEVQQRAIHIYVLNPKYKNINGLFRSEKHDNSPERLLVTSQDPDYKKDMLTCFIVGCLLNDAANKITGLADANQLTLPKEKIFDRAEQLNDIVIQARLANPWSLPALTSFSIRKEGSPYFYQPGIYRTKLENPPRLYVINEDEGEVFLPQGLQVETTKGADCLISRIVNSPSFETKNHYWSDLALTYAFERYLSKEYNEAPSSIIQNIPVTDHFSV